MGLFDLFGLFKHKPASMPTNDQPFLPKEGKRHQVAGIEHYMDNVMSLAKENPNYSLAKADLIRSGYIGIDVHRYLFEYETAELVQEPDNPKDPKAIKIVVAGRHIGYIKAGSCSQVINAINQGRIVTVLCRIYGGPSKYVYQDNDDASGKYILKNDKVPIRAEIRIIEKA